MANTYNGTVVTKYLSLEGLTSFWSKVKNYVDDQDSALLSLVKTNVEAKDAALRSYLHGLTVNGEGFAKTDGSGLAITIDGADIKVGESGATDAENTYKDSDIATSIDALDSRATAIETKLAEGVVSDLTIRTAHGKYGDPAADKAWVDVKFADGKGGPNGEIDVTIDDTAINTKFAALDTKIVDLEANAGVTDIKVVDTPSGDDADNFVAITISGTKDSEVADAHRGVVTVTVNETALQTKLSDMDSAHTTEVADRKEDIMKLAGSGYTPAEGDTAAAWTTWPAKVKTDYQTIVGLATRVQDIDDSLVTKVEVEDASDDKTNYVTLKVDDANTSGTGDIKLILDDSKLEAYVEQADDNLTTLAAALDATNVNGLDIFTGAKFENGKLSATGARIDLTSADITYSETSNSVGSQSLTDVIDEMQAAIDALSNATHFLGKSTTAISDGKSEAPTINGTVIPVDDLQDGDVVFYNVKEFIWSNGAWVELGDTTIENDRLTALETWVNTAIISYEGDESDIAKLGYTKPAFSWE